MGMEAELIGIGPFQPELTPHLDYPADWYADVQPGTRIITTVLRARTSTTSRDLAEAFGFGATDLGWHYIPAPVHVPRYLNGLRVLERDLDGRVDDFRALAEAGFEFFYRPNG